MTDQERPSAAPQDDITSSLWELAREYQRAADGALKRLSTALTEAEARRDSTGPASRNIRATRIRDAHDHALIAANALIDLAHEALKRLADADA